MSEPALPYTIVHNLARQRFEATLPSGVAHTDYIRIGETLNMVHTEVPKAASGEGVGAELVTAALDYARANGLKIIPTCPYVRAYMRKHADTNDLLARGARL